MSKMKPRRIRSIGSSIEIVSGPESSYVSKIQREHRFAYELVNVSRYHASEAKKAGKDNYWRVRSNVISAINASYSALEATYNEFINVIALGDHSPLDDLKREVIHFIASENLAPEPKQNTLQRFNMLLRILEKEEINPSSEPYQSVNLVRLLRNMLVHPLPGTVVTFDITDPDLSTQQEIVRKLRSHLKLDRTSTFPDDILVPACAAWASRSAERFLAEFERSSGVDLGFVLQVD